LGIGCWGKGTKLDEGNAFWAWVTDTATKPSLIGESFARHELQVKRIYQTGTKIAPSYEAVMPVSAGFSHGNSTRRSLKLRGKVLASTEKYFLGNGYS